MNHPTHSDPERPGSAIAHAQGAIRIGEFIIVAAITLVTNHFVSFTVDQGHHTVCITGTPLGCISAGLLVLYVVGIWLKYEYYLRYFAHNSHAYLWSTYGNYLAVLFLAVAAVLALDGSSGTPSSMHSFYFLAGALTVLWLCDLLIAA